LGTGGFKDRIMRKKKLLAAIGLISLVTLAVVLNLMKNREGSMIPVQVARVELKEMKDSVFATGRVKLVEKQDVYADNAATVKRLYVRPGDRVTRGQLLVVLDDGDAESRLKESRAVLEQHQSNYSRAVATLPLDIQKLRAEVDRAEAGVEAARAKHDRFQSLHLEGAVSAQDFETARLEYLNKEADLKSARAGLEAKESGLVQQNEIKALEAQANAAMALYERAERQYSRVNVRADMDGLVFSAEVSEGDMVAPRARIMTVGNPDRLEVSASISEGDSGRLKVGQRVEIKAAALPGKKFRGILTGVAPGAVSRNNERGGVLFEIPVLVSVEGDTEGLRPGYTADISITTAEVKQAMVVPYESVIEKEEKKYALVLESGKARQVEIKTGISTELFTEVLQGLGEGDRVIISPGDKVKDGTGVKEVPGTRTGPQEGGK